MISREILDSFCVNYFEFELLKEENPPEQSRLGIFFSKEIFEGGVIRIHNAFVKDEHNRLHRTLAQKVEDDGINDKLDPKVFVSFKTLVILDTLSMAKLVVLVTLSFLSL
ncbi:hypothetical protein Tco_1322748, partial [Tanacetum coccineum]